jgi:hypothetical protein
VRELGRTTEDRPYLVAIVSAPETMANLGSFQRLQRRLTDPRIKPGPTEPSDAVAESKAVVAITCSIHSTETASTFMAMELLHELATRDDPATREILDTTIVLLVPSANPDGIDKVARWYERTKGKPWEGSGDPELYHKYAGHDTNRDWFMLNLKETQLLTRLLYQEWFPTALYDVHQMGSRGARLFVPPFHDPINPNIDPRIHQSIAMIGSHMAGDLAAAGKRGILTNAMYDNWWNGGNRTTPQRHNIVAVLTEAASVRLASPIFLEKEELRGASRGFDDQRPAVNFVDPWPGGWWRLRDIVDYELVCARSLLRLAARYKNQFQSNLQAMGRDAVEAGRTSPPYAWVVPSDQRDPGTAATMVRILHDTGIDVERAPRAFRASGRDYPAGSWILSAAQPNRAHLKDMMERQVYPARFTPKGEAEQPYDVAGWTLPLQMGVQAVPLTAPLTGEFEALERIEPIRGRITDGADAETLVIERPGNDDFRLLNAMVANGVDVREYTQLGNPAAGAWIGFAADAKSRGILERVLPTISTRLVPLPDVTPPRSLRSRSVSPARLGVYQPWIPSMDEGWTRLVLEKFGFVYTTVHNDTIQAGDLINRFDTLLVPSITAKVLRDGYTANQTEPAYVGGLGSEGVQALRSFVEAGGTLVCLEDSCTFAIDELALPVTNVLKGLKSSTFFGPGSLVRVKTAGGFNLTWGVPDELSAYFDHSLAFETASARGPAVNVLVTYASDNVLESGWLLGPRYIQGKAALLEVRKGAGRVFLFGFPPQHRGQTHGTFRLLFNALLKIELGG